MISQQSSIDDNRIVAETIARGAPLLHGTCSEVYLEKAFDGTKLRPKTRLPNARELGETSLMLLTHPTLKEAEVTQIGSITASVLAEASK